MTSERRLFGAATAMLGYSTRDVSARIGCTYNRLVPVLEGVRTPSPRLSVAIHSILQGAKPLFMAALDDV